MPTTERLALLRLQIVAGELAARIGARIRQRRRELGITTQRELADKIARPSITNQVVSNWERGVNKPGDENLALLAEALGVGLDYFYEAGDSEGTPDLLDVFSKSDVSPLERLERKIDALLLGVSQLLEAGAIPEPSGELGRILRDAQTTPEQKQPPQTRPGQGRRASNG